MDSGNQNEKKKKIGRDGAVADGDQGGVLGSGVGQRGAGFDELDNMYKLVRDDANQKIPDLLIYPTNEYVAFPGSVMALNIVDNNRLLIVEEALKTNTGLFILPYDRNHSTFDPDACIDVVGTEVRILKREKIPQCDVITVTVFGMRRLSLKSMYVKGDYFYGNFTHALDLPLASMGDEMLEDRNLLRQVRLAVRNLWDLQGEKREMKEIMRIIERSNDPGCFCDLVAASLEMPFEKRLIILQAVSVRERLEILLGIFVAQKEANVTFSTTAKKVREDLEKQQRDFFIRQHIKALRKQIGDNEPEPEPSRDEEEIIEKLKNLQAPAEAKAYIEKQYKRLTFLSQSSAEYAAARSHVETLLDIPWKTYSEDQLDLNHAREILDADHYGLKDVKDRIVEYLAVLSLRKDFKAPILCLYGPPGVGKTSIGKSIARALGRKFERVSLGGIHDESEIRGHRRTYVASMPGRIVQAIRHAQTMNPVILLDEIDKLSHHNQGDPASALLEVLDPEQHHAFVDNYIETPIDLSQVLFLTTANSLDTIPGPLRDRMEIIEIPGYTHVDKRFIAQDFLIPKVLKEHGLVKSNLAVSEDALDDIINFYTREAGVRKLEHCLAGVCRKVAAHVVTAKQAGKRRATARLTRKNLPQYLGKQKYDFDMVEAKRRPGIATGLAWTPVGGDILFIETTHLPGKGQLVITGKLGDVMQESIRAATTLLRGWLANDNASIDFEKEDIHVHVPAGATPKDGPSAGVAIFCALLSLYKDVSIPATIAMTGEISLRGNVLPVGGIREKVLGAHRAGIRTILLPEKNKADLDDVPQEVRNDIKFHFLHSIDDCVRIVFPKS